MVFGAADYNLGFCELVENSMVEDIMIEDIKTLKAPLWQVPNGNKFLTAHGGHTPLPPWQGLSGNLERKVK